jgi:hypothetical protein
MLHGYLRAIFCWCLGFVLGLTTPHARTDESRYFTDECVPTRIVLNRAGGTGMRWLLASHAGVKLLDSTVSRRSGAPGAEVEDAFVLIFSLAGHYSLTWQLGRPGEVPEQTETKVIEVKERQR